jgi:hypothetical protein
METKRIRAIYRLKGYRKARSGMYVRYVPCWSCKGLSTVKVVESDGYPEIHACSVCDNGKVIDVVWPNALENKWKQKS